MRYIVIDKTIGAVIYDGNNKATVDALYYSNGEVLGHVIAIECHKENLYEEYLEEQGILPDTKKVLLLVRNLYENLCTTQNPSNALDFIEEIETALKRDYIRR